MFLVSAANNRLENIRDYPNYLLHETKDTKIIDPATSAHALTVSAIRNHADHPGNIGNWPSTGTRIGLGFKDMIKPELTIFGGDKHDDVTCLQWQFLKYGPFRGDYGTSMSAALVSHYLAKLTAKYKDEDRNLIMAYLLSSAEIPSRPPQINEIQRGCGEDVIKENLRIYGYGKPNLNHALFSGGSHVILKNSSSIGLNKVDFFQFYLPDIFFKALGPRKISVTLVYDPLTNKRKATYMGVQLDYKLFKNATLAKIQKEYGVPAEEVNLAYESPKLDRHKIDLVPGPSLRNNSTHQHSFIEYEHSPRFKKELPLVLAVRCRNRWIMNADYTQHYGVVVKLTHSAKINLYSEVRNINRIKLVERARVTA